MLVKETVGLDQVTHFVYVEVVSAPVMLMQIVMHNRHASLLHSSSDDNCRHSCKQSTVKLDTCQAAAVKSRFGMSTRMVTANTVLEAVFQLQAGLCAVCQSI